MRSHSGFLAAFLSLVVAVSAPAQTDFGPELVPQLGPCCFAGGECRILDANACVEAEGFPLGEDLPCDPSPCWGACCPETGGCFFTDYWTCVVPLGAFLGSGTTCEGDPCDLGACCLPDGTCVMLHPNDCAQSGGEFTYEMYPCELDPCDTSFVPGGPAPGPQPGTATPNPFTRTTTLSWSGTTGMGDLPVVPGGGRACILDAAGRFVCSLTSERTGPGEGRASWDGTDAAGHLVPTGVYYARIDDADGGEATRSIRIVRLH